jgi:hypothetical protein
MDRHCNAALMGTGVIPGDTMHLIWIVDMVAEPF